MSAGQYSIGGFSTVMEMLGKKLVDKGYDVTIAALFFKDYPSESPCDVAKLPVGNLFKLKGFLRQFDFIHNHHPITNYLAFFSDCPFLYHCHGAINSGASLRWLNMISSIKLTNNYLDAIIAISEFGKTELAKYFGYDKLHLLYNGVDTTFFKSDIEQKFKKGSPQFLFVGNLYKHKNIEELLFAVKLLTENYPRIHLYVVGEGSCYQHLKQLISDLRLENYVELIGRVPRFILPYYYASCDVYVTPSRWELFGLPLLEAMACGKPVVASSIPSHIELLTKSKAGEFYPQGDVKALSEIMIKTFDEREDYVDNALSFAKEHDWTNVANSLSKLYSQLM